MYCKACLAAFPDSGGVGFTCKSHAIFRRIGNIRKSRTTAESAMQLAKSEDVDLKRLYLLHETCTQNFNSCMRIAEVIKHSFDTDEGLFLHPGAIETDNLLHPLRHAT